MGGADDAEAGPGSEADSWEVWDPRRSLFDNHLSNSLEANLEYMWRRFHFSIPDVEYLQDAPGLLTYLVRAASCCWSPSSAGSAHSAASTRCLCTCDFAAR